MLLPPIKWLLIDLDNTLLDFDKAAGRSLEIAYQRFEISTHPENINLYKQINHECWSSFEQGHIDVTTLKDLRFRKLVEAMKLEIDHRKLNRFYLDTLAEQVDEIVGARDFLEWAAPRFRLVLATNGFAEVQRPRIRKSGLDLYFDHIAISEEIGWQKPHAPFFDHIFQSMQYPHRSEVLMVGDSLSSDIAGGHAYGIHTCWYNPKSSANGHEIRPDLSIKHLHELKTLLPE